MSSAVLNWTPINDANSTGQKVEFKLNSSPTWTVFSNVAKNISTETVTGLTPNFLYSFRVLNECAVGGESPSNQDEGIVIVCPSPVTLTPTSNTIAFSFSKVTGDVTNYVVQLLNSTGSTVLDSQTFASPGATITGTFSSLSVSTAYKVKVITNVTGLLRSYSLSCTAQDTSTTAAPTCNAPTNVTATMS